MVMVQWAWGLLFVSGVLWAAPSDWTQLQRDMSESLDDRQALLNEFFNDEAPQLHPHGWPDADSRFMFMAQGSSLLVDRSNQANAAWQDRHDHAHNQWNDLVIEGKPRGNWRYFVNLNATAEEAKLDEGFITAGLGYGIQLKLGQFFSGFGRLNSQHTHDRDFVDAPLVYKRLFGEGTALQEKGVQLSFLPSKTWMLGVEQLSATNRDQFNDDRAKPALSTVFSRWGEHWGNGLHSLLGASVAQGQVMGSVAQQTAQWSGIDLTIKQWLNDDDYWQVQGEWLRRDIAGDAIADFEASQGYYLMGLYRWHPQWRAGIRYEGIQPDDRALSGNTRQSLLLEHDPNTWLRTRLQLGEETQSTGLTGLYALLGWQASLHWLP